MELSGCELVRRSLSERSVRSELVVVDAPTLDDPARIGQRCKHAVVEAFIAKLAVETFDERVLRRLPWRDMM